MTTRFDDSLPILVSTIVDELGEDHLRSGVVLRDATGRLAFFSRTKPSGAAQKRISARLREALGPYARTDRVFVGSDAFGAEDILQDSASLGVSVSSRGSLGQTYRIRLVDRRIVGTD